jgi:hypothetical protein
MRKHILLGRGRCINKKNMYDDTTTRSFAVRKDYGRRVGTVKDVKYQNKVFKPLKFKHLNI